MARSFSNAKVFSAVLVDGFSNAIYRRGYAASSQGLESSVAKGITAGSNVMAKKAAEKTKEKVAWVPDPATGYYRPENRAAEIDVAELRATFSKNKAKA